MSKEEFIELFLNIPGEYSIGIHGISRTNDYVEAAKSILNEGLKLYDWGGILRSVMMLGRLKNMDDRDKRKLFNYFYDGPDCDGRYVDVVFAFPKTLKDFDDKEYYLGFFKKVSSGYGKGIDAAGAGLPLNMMAEADHLVPREFIVGYMVHKCNSEYFEFVPNDCFIGLASEFKQKEYFESIKDRLIDEFNLVDKEGANKVISFFKKSGMEIPEYFKQVDRYFDENEMIK